MMNFNEFSSNLLQKHYCRKGETIEQAFARACNCFASDMEQAKRLYTYIEKKWFMFSSPILSNAINKGDKVKGLPISCFLTYVDDSIKGLCDHTTELRWLSVKGGGVGGHWSDVRSMDKITPGPLSFLHTVDADMVAYKQGSTRRGSYGAYIDVSHPDIIEFIKMRTPTGDINRKSLNLHHGINITDEFINAVDNNLDFNLVDPHTKEVRDTVKARHIWEEILTTRFRTGEPYINYIDEANRRLFPGQIAKGLTIKGSNLCNEIHLPTSTDRTAVCCLSSVNLATFDEWKGNDLFIADLIEMLDNVLQFFIDNAPEELSRAVHSAIQERSLGLGAMGFHDYLMAHSIPIESGLAVSVNKGMFKLIKSKAVEASERLAELKGEAPDAEGYCRRNTHLLAIAPNANSSIILGVSPSIEPRASNGYTHKTRVGSYLVKNPILERVLEYKYNKNTKDVWDSIVANDGSVQHLDFLEDLDKEVFKTANEIDQRYIIDLARVRQKYICQGQSINLFLPSGSNKEYVNAVHRRAFSRDGIGVPLKGLYYLRTTSSRGTEKVSLKIQRDALKDGVNETCLSCEG